jgi:hypothetical protein
VERKVGSETWWKKMDGELEQQTCLFIPITAGLSMMGKVLTSELSDRNNESIDEV